MATAVIMPKLGLTMVEAIIIEWKKQEGEKVEKGEVLLVIETDKVTFEVEAAESGFLSTILVPAGEKREIGEVLAYIVQPGEALPDEVARQVSYETGTGLPAPEERPQEPVSVPAPGGALGTRQGKIKISPLARRLAEEHGVDVSALRGTGPGGRIVKEDILRTVDQAGKAPAGSPAIGLEGAAPAVGKTPGVRLVKPGGMRRTIARRMTESFQTPHFWICRPADATRLREARERLLPGIERETGLRLTYTDLVIKIVARALRGYPEVNSRWTEQGIELLDDINIGVATSVREGLVVPVIRGADTKSLGEVTRLRSDLVSRGREGRLGLDELSGSTITITNLGMEGVEYGFPIINPPEASIIALSAISERPFVLKGQLVPLLSVNITLGIDHRILDGFIAARFLGRIIELMEEPLLLL
jgi:pyruvate dehydrogenase E2 component (dihydrolipoamide acetyltransferase)